MRIGIYGGSFNPVHLGHLIAAECCREQARLDRVLFMPAATPPHKQGQLLADAADRVAMLTLAVGGHEAFAVSTIEVDRGGVSYTVDTLAALAERHPHDTLVLVLGPDALAQLPTWREPQTIADRCELVAVERERLDDVAAIARDAGLADLLGQERLAALIAARVRMPAIGVRASDLRAAVASGTSIRYRTPRAVEAFVMSHGLYRDG
ncbi:MAG: nicotinate (nicotinamide) nucleotide adenylyltransferase [Planctomycetota bacterium]|jgi:nicotinate-nucleotide adenylyltransferase|nr:MAG: nicotinate (nicotinamide) nucleotide adenylyltransferase [Planctomycetota bacterium]